MILKKCNDCGALVKVLEDSECIKCCGSKMEVVKSNSVDASFEKHVPTFEVVGNKLVVTVNHVMDSDHYIEWICFESDNKEEIIYLKPGMDAKVEFNYQKGMLYAYCNKHGLWESEVK